MRTRATRAAAKAIRDVNRARFTVFGACPGLLLLCIVARVWTAPRRTCFMRGAFPRVVSCGSPPRALGCDAPLYFASLLSARRVGVGGGGLRRGRVRAGGGWHGSGVGWGLKFETEVDAVHTLRQCMAQSCLAATKQPSMALFESLLSHSEEPVHGECHENGTRRRFRAVRVQQSSPESSPVQSSLVQSRQFSPVPRFFSIPYPRVGVLCLRRLYFGYGFLARVWVGSEKKGA